MHFHRAECVSKQKEHLSVTHYKYNNAKATKSSFFDSCQKTQIRNGLNRNRGALGIGQVTIHKTVQLYILVLVELNYARVLHVHSSIRNIKLFPLFQRQKENRSLANRKLF